MQVHTQNAEMQMIEIVSSIDLRPDSWSGWHILRIEAGEYLSHQEFLDATLPIKAIVGSYLREIEGAAFFCAKKFIYIVCKGPQKNILKQSAQQISELVFEEIYLSSRYDLFDLSNDTQEFVERVFKDIGGNRLSAVSEGQIEPNVFIDKVPYDISHTKVLLVEDDAVIRWMIRNSLKDECEFAAAGDGQSVFTLYPSFKPDIVFLDIGLPDVSGYDILEWMTQQNHNANIIMLSAQDNLQNLTQYLTKGAKAFIPKPFLKENLIHYIRLFAPTETA